MRKIPGKARVLTAICALFASVPAVAGDYIISQKQTGFTLPGVTLPSGQDEIRASDGTSCRSSIANSGAYLDTGIIVNEAEYDAAAYGRIVIPLGRKPKRLDCSRLYQLEVERLRLELELVKRGLSSSSRETAGEQVGWDTGPGWTHEGRDR